MKALKLICSFFILSSIVSCEEKQPIIDSNNLLVGHWSNATYENDKITFQRTSKLVENTYGVSFKNDYTFINYSSGFCGTPPLTFYNTEGVWELVEDDLVKVNLQSFPNNFNWKIVSLTEKELVVKRALSDQEEDHKALMNLFNEFANLASSVCSDASKWTYTAYGSKACGGPQGYIAYPINIDTAAFLQKVADYTKSEHQYNIKWGIASTCDIPLEPIGVECENGIPVLKY